MDFTHHLKSLINIKGSLSISQFMQEALFHPKYGYYQKGNPIGKDGDFTTSPEISQVFGELIGLYFLNIISHTKKPVAFVEMGAGTGRLLRDLLVMVQKLADKNIVEAQKFLQQSSFHIIEVSPSLQKVQQKTLSEMGVEIKWHVDFQTFTQSLQTEEELCFMANELFDCFPIDQFIKTQQGWCEKVVSLKDEALDFFIEDINPMKSKMIENLVSLEKESEAKQGDVFEHSSSAISFMQELSKTIHQRGGLALIIDYGYCQNAFKNSLQSVKKHQFHNCLENIGDADMTSLVNFSALDNVAKEEKLQTSLVSQGEFLKAVGVEERRKLLLAGKTEAQQKDINTRIDRLIDADQMGDLFKCLIIWK